MRVWTQVRRTKHALRLDSNLILAVAQLGADAAVAQATEIISGAKRGRAELAGFKWAPGARLAHLIWDPCRFGKSATNWLRTSRFAGLLGLTGSAL